MGTREKNKTTEGFTKGRQRNRQFQVVGRHMDKVETLESGGSDEACRESLSLADKCLL
jgi:hypothetical protein